MLFDEALKIHPKDVSTHLRRASNPLAAERIRADGIDIPIDLTGYTEHGRTASVGCPNRALFSAASTRATSLAPAFFDVWISIAQHRAGQRATARRCEPLGERQPSTGGGTTRRRRQTPGILSADFAAGVSSAPRVADLLVDTLPYNASATASDALWAGLPMLTCSGSTYVGRMAGALLAAAELQLITTWLEAYERLALRLATEPGLLTG